MELEEIKLFLRVDSDDEDTLIQDMQSAAEIYLLNAGVTQTYDNKLYCLVVKMLITHWYENRSVILIGSISKALEYSLSSIILQLNYTSEVIV